MKPLYADEPGFDRFSVALVDMGATADERYAIVAGKDAMSAYALPRPAFSQPAGPYARYPHAFIAVQGVDSMDEALQCVRSTWRRLNGRTKEIGTLGDVASDFLGEWYCKSYREAPEPEDSGNVERLDKAM